MKNEVISFSNGKQEFYFFYFFDDSVSNGGKSWWEIMVEKCGGKMWWEIMVEKSGGKKWWEKVVGKSGGKNSENFRHFHIFLYGSYIKMSSDNSLDNYLFGPLDKRYCFLFYVFSIISFISFLILLFGSIVAFVKGTKKFSPWEMVSVVYLLALSFIGYITQRLFYSMCVKSNMAEN